MPCSQRPIPILQLPSISPIFENAPAFLTARVDSDGTLRDIDDHALHDGVWHDLGGFAELGVHRFTGAALIDLEGRLTRDPAARAHFASLYESGARAEIDAANWPVYRCAATAFTATAFRACLHEGGISILTTRGLAAATAAILLFAAMGLAIVRRKAPTPPGSPRR
jgi:hypothetical protein